jgi:hypothetical protein
MIELYKIYSGIEFKALTENQKYYKILRDDLIHHGFSYKLGINEDVLNFHPHGNCSPGGLYFTDLDNIVEYITYGNNIAEIEILDDSEIYVESKKCKASKFNIISIYSLYDFISNLPYDIQLFIVKQNGYVLQFIENQTPELCKEALQNGIEIKFIKNKTEDLCKLAVSKNGISLIFIKNQTDEICKIAVQQYGKALKFVENQTFEICRLAVDQDYWAMQYIKCDKMYYEIKNNLKINKKRKKIIL